MPWETWPSKDRKSVKPEAEVPVVAVEPTAVAPAAQEAAPAFDGQPLPDGSVRYKILCDGGIDPSGVFWVKIVPPGASTDDYVAAQAERDEALKRLARLQAPRG